MAFAILQLGLGNRGKMWADVIARNGGATLAAAVDPGEGARAAFAGLNPQVPLFATLDEALLAGGPYDAAVLVTPPDGHLEQCRTLFGHGLPILAEKPLATDLAGAMEIVRLSDERRLQLTVGLNFRYLPVHRKLRELLTGTFVGEVGFGQFSYRRNRDGKRPGLNKYPLFMDQPMMLEQSIHHLDLIRFCHDREVETVTCRTWNPPWSMYAHDANVHALLTLEDGVEVNYFGTWCGGWNELAFEWRTDCAEGAIIQRQLFSDLAYVRTADAAPTSIRIADAEPFFDDTAALLEDFLASVRDGTTAPCDGRDHLRTLGLCFAAIESSESGKTVKLADFYARSGLSRVL